MHVQEKFILVNVYITNKMSTFSLYIYIFIYVRMEADATVAPTCIDIIYILHAYLSLCVIIIYYKCVSTNKYCLLSIIMIHVTFSFEIINPSK
jgi:hypothetical protein